MNEIRECIDILKIIRAGNIQAIKPERLTELAEKIISALDLFLKVSEGGVKKKAASFGLSSEPRTIQEAEIVAFNEALDLSNLHWAGKLMELNNEKLNFNFKCGCFIICYIGQDLKLRAGLACCKEHEHPYAKVEDFYLRTERKIKHDPVVSDIVIDSTERS